MKVSSTNQIITPKSTGYIATTALGVATLSGISRNRNIRKAHKPTAYLTAILTALHIGLIEYYHHKFKNSNL